MLAAVVLTPAQDTRAWPWDKFLDLYYVADNAPYADGYGRRPTNRFRLLWDVKAVALIPEPEPYLSYVSHNGRRLIQRNDGESPITERAFVASTAFEQALSEFLECRPDLAALASELYVAERVISPVGTFISAFLQRTDSSLHLVTIVLRNSAGCAVPSERAAPFDPESPDSVESHGGYARQV